MATQRSRRWVFTWNNPSEADGVPSALVADERVTYVVCQRESAPSTGTVHLQGYAEFRVPVRLSAVRSLIECHWEIARGTPSECRDYCSKSDSRDVDGGPWEHGQMSGGQGRRSDLRSAMEAAAAGASQLALIEDHPSVMARYSTFVNSYKRMKVAPTLRRNLKVLVYMGKTGSGKSRAAYEQYPMAFRKMSCNKWFDGYMGQKEVIWDDFDTTAVDFRWFLTLIDIYPVTVEVKGSSVQFEPEVIVFTTNIHPRDWFKELDEATRAPLYRRITEIRNFDVPLLGGVPLWNAAAIPTVQGIIDLTADD